MVLPRLAAGWLDTLRREAAITVVLFGAAQTNPEVGAALQHRAAALSIARTMRSEMASAAIE